MKFNKIFASRFAPLLWTALAVLVWTFSSKALQDILVFGAFAWAVFHFRRGANVWRRPAGIAFAALLAHTLLMLPFSCAPAKSLRCFSGMIEVYAGMFAIGAIFNDRPKLEAAFLYSAIAIALTLGYDLARLWVRLDGRIMADAHSYQPFILNHSNVASMMAGAAVFVFFYFFWRNRSRPARAAACLAGMLLCLAYMVVAASRGPQAAFAAAAACAGLLIPGRRGKFIWFCTVAAAGLLVAANLRHISPRFLEKDTMRNFSERTVVWGHAWELAKEHPVMGHGYGKRLFEEVYYSSDPPAARFHFPHTHQYWLKILFEYGWVGMALYLAAWLTLGVSLAMCVYRLDTFTERLFPGVIGLLLIYVHVYGMADFPDNIVQTMQLWLVPAALVAIAVCHTNGNQSSVAEAMEDKLYR